MDELKNVRTLLKKVKTLRNGFKIILGYVLLNLICLTLWDEWGSEMYIELGYLCGSDFEITFNGDTFFVSLFCLLIYWILWGHKK